MTNKTDVTRRTFGGMIAATAVAAPGVVSAAVRQPRDETIFERKSVPLAWPQYHKFDSFAEPPNVGDKVTLVREAQHSLPGEAEGVAVYTSNFKRIGYIPRQHNGAFTWALKRGEAREARISEIAEPIVRGKQIRGWGAFHIDVRVSAAALA